jgi:hypothetical protein
VVIDDVLPLLEPRGVGVRERAEAIEGRPDDPHPARTDLMGLDDAIRMPGHRKARDAV